jgi:hypothetical protein
MKMVWVILQGTLVYCDLFFLTNQFYLIFIVISPPVSVVFNHGFICLFYSGRKLRTILPKLLPKM